MCGKGTGTFSAGSEHVSPDIITLTSVIASLERAEGKENVEKMDRVFADAVERQIVLPSNSMDTKWEIDLSGMSLPVARAACRFIAKRLRDTEDITECQDLMLITGIGRHHQSVPEKGLRSDNAEELSNKEIGTTALREYVREILQGDFEPPLSSEAPAGVVLVKRDVMKKWLVESQG